MSFWVVDVAIHRIALGHGTWNEAHGHRGSRGLGAKDTEALGHAVHCREQGLGHEELGHAHCKGMDLVGQRKHWA